MTRILLYGCAVLSLGLLASGYFLGGYLLPAFLLLVVGVPWMIGLARRWNWVPPLCLLAAFGFAGLGFLLNLGPVLLIPGACFALLAWDLADFADRLRLSAVEDDVAGLERSHLMRLAAVTAAGGGLSAAAMAIHAKAPFELTVILVLLAVWGIGRMASWLSEQQT